MKKKAKKKKKNKKSSPLRNSIIALVIDERAGVNLFGIPQTCKAAR